jgi:hypothetical protein
VADPGSRESILRCDVAVSEAGFQWIDAGLDVAFDDDSRRRYRALSRVPPATRSARITEEAEFADRVVNMDW